MLALALVVALIYGCRSALKRMGKGGVRPGAAGVAGPVEVLSRTSIGAKQQMLLVRVGKRVLLVGSWPGGMANLGEVTDAGELSAMTAPQADRRGSPQTNEAISPQAVADKIRQRLDGKDAK